MMKVYLIRHAQSEENVLNLRERTTASAFNAALRGSPDVPLTEQGRRQALTIIEKLAAEGVDQLYSSPFLRAISTAKIVGEALGLRPEVLEDLREVLPYPVRESLRARSVRGFWIRSYLSMLLPDSERENWRSAYRRARAVWERLTLSRQGTVAVVSHRGLISLILLSLRRSRDWRILRRDLANGGVSLVVRKDFR